MKQSGNPPVLHRDQPLGPAANGYSQAQVPVAGFECALIEGSPDAALVRVAGELDIATAPILQRTLRETCNRAGVVVLDLRELTFMDSSGLRVVIDACRDAARDERLLLRLRGPAHVERVFEITGTAASIAILDETSADPAVRDLLVLDGSPEQGDRA